MTPIASKTFSAPLIRHGSWGHQTIGTHASTMDLYLNTDDTGYIEWDIPAIDDGETIGLTFDFSADGTRTLSDYDGVMSLPLEAIELMRAVGIIVPSEFED